MENTIISFMIDALISSDIQFNIIDNNYNQSNESDVGSRVKSLGIFIKNNIFNQLEYCNTAIDILKKIVEICVQMDPPSDILHFISIFLNNIIYFFEIINPEYIKYINLTKRKPCILNECIVINEDDDDMKCDDQLLNFKNISIGKPQHMWINAIKYSIENFVSFNSDLYKQSYILNGLLITLKCSIDIFENNNHCDNEVDDIILLTDIIEEFSSENLILFKDDKPNPAMQILSTAFRSLTEAIKQNRLE